MNENVKYFFKRLYDKLFEEDTLGNSAQVAFYFSFSLFPLLLFLISLFGLILGTADDFRLELFQYLRRLMPLSAYELVLNTITEVMEKSSGGKITLGILIALWSASAGLDSLRGALNEVYNLKETRPFWKTRPLSLILTLAIGLLIFIALGIIFYGSQFIVWLLAAINLPIPSPFFLWLLKWITVFVVLQLAFALIYNISPDRKIFRWQWITPGAIAGIILWLLVSNGFRVYLQYFDTYSKTYGSLGAMIILMLWLYLTALVILIGAVINQILEEIYDKIKLVEESKIIASSASKPEPKKTSEPKIAVVNSINVNSSDENEARTTDIQTKQPVETNITHNFETIKELNGQESEIREQLSDDENILDNDKSKPILSFTIAGVFVVMMGLMFRKKINKS